MDNTKSLSRLPAEKLYKEADGLLLLFITLTKILDVYLLEPIDNWAIIFYFFLYWTIIEKIESAFLLFRFHNDEITV